MARKIVDLSARSRYLREEPFHLHFWENSVEDYLAFLRDPRGQLEEIGIVLPPDCRIETVIENHDWLAAQTNGLTAEDGTIVCNIGGGNVARDVYRVISYAHTHEAVGRHEKRLLHGTDEEEYLPARAGSSSDVSGPEQQQLIPSSLQDDIPARAGEHREGDAE
jgi:hypothetical protein